MTDRKKKGIGYFVSGVVLIVIGIIGFSMEVDPGWLPTVVTLVGIVMDFFGFKKVFPDTD